MHYSVLSSDDAVDLSDPDEDEEDESPDPFRREDNPALNAAQVIGEEKPVQTPSKPRKIVHSRPLSRKGGFDDRLEIFKVSMMDEQARRVADKE